MKLKILFILPIVIFLLVQWIQPDFTFIENLNEEDTVPLLDWVPDVVTRAYIRYLLGVRLDEERGKSVEERARYIQELKERQFAYATAEANEQHYEVPSEYFMATLGNRLKYSGSFYETPESTLNDAEITSLENYIKRSGIDQPGVESVLDLGCGWGSFTLYAAEKFPQISFTAISNSATQRKYILGQAETKGLKNVKVITGNIAVLDIGESLYDRVISIEMFEHMKNYEALMKKVYNVLKPEGKLFVQVFCHREYAYDFMTDSWMGRNFFTGGTMPNAEFLTYFKGDFELENQFFENGTHYERTSNDWLKNQDKNEDKIMKVFEKEYGDKARKHLLFWRIFYMACAELFGYENGNQWLVTHYVFKK